MEVNIKLNIDWIGEDYSLDDSVKEQVINQLTMSFKSGMKDNVKRKVNKN